MLGIIDFLERSPGIGNTAAKFVDLSNKIEFTYQEMSNIAGGVAAILKGVGVKPGEIVATLSNNSVSSYCCIFGISKANAVWIPLNVKNTVEANLKLVSSSNATKVFVDQNILDEDDGELTQALGDKIISMTPYKILDENLEALAESTDNRLESKGSSLSVPNENHLLSLFPTGGTTGDSKLCEWSELTWLTMVSTQSDLMPLKQEEGAYLIITPMTHASGVASFAPIYQGCSVLIMEGLENDTVLRTIQEKRVTSLFLPPTAIYMLLSHPTVKDYDYSSLQYFLYAAAPMSVEKLKEAIDVFGPVMIQSFGQAEAPMFITSLSVEDHVDALHSHDYERLRSCGKATPGLVVGIIDEDGNEMPTGYAGEIALKGSLMMSKYYQSSEQTNAIRINGWQGTGDIGVKDRHGYITIVDRKRDMIISGGFNVFPSEIEQVLWGHPSVQDCAVIGVPDEKWGEKVTAVIELKQGQEQPEESELIRFCKDKLGSIKSPKSILYRPSLPRSPVGKVLKKEIRKEFWETTDRNI
ncbi:MAG: AMP-binding protein [Pseudomonadales bacterium]|nr:AMP-binding protein [Pseudomonadales bacterium]